MILVTGATGNLGSFVIDQLIRKTNVQNFEAFARNTEKAEVIRNKGVNVRIGDFDDVESLMKAMEGVSKLLLISTKDFNRFNQHKNVIDCAQKAGVKHIVYTSLSHNNPHLSATKELIGTHYTTEDYLKKSGIVYTIVRNALYIDAFKKVFIQDNITKDVYLPGGDGKIPLVLKRELGEAIGNILLEDGHLNQTYNLVGSKAYSLSDAAKTFSKIFDKNIQYNYTDAGILIDILREAGLSEFLNYLISGTIYDMEHHYFEVESDVMEKLIGRPTANLEQMIKELFQFD